MCRGLCGGCVDISEPSGQTVSPEAPPKHTTRYIFYRGDVYGDTLPGRVLHDTPVAKAYRSRAWLWANFA